jgi:hypothetical protein
MMLNDTFLYFCWISYFLAFVNGDSKFFCRISVSFEFWKFWSHNKKAMAKDKEVNIAVT